MDNTISTGFHIGLEGEHVYYDFTDEAITDVLKAFSNPDLRAILDGEDG